MYDPEAVQWMRDELTYVGFEELLTPDAANEALAGSKGSVLVMINSVCGCAAGSARPGVTMALQHAVIPDRFVTVFAGQDRDAVDHVRNMLVPHPPSSPSMALFVDGKPAYFMSRQDIEGRYPQEIAAMLTEQFDKLCTRQGPSIPKEKYDLLEHARACGSKIPRLN